MQPNERPAFAEQVYVLSMHLKILLYKTGEGHLFDKGNGGLELGLTLRLLHRVVQQF